MSSALQGALCLFFLILPLSIAGTNMAAALLAALALALAYRGEIRWDRSWNAVLLALAAYAGAAVIAGLAGLDPALSLKSCPKDLHKLWILATLFIVFSKQPNRRGFNWLCAGFSVLAVIGLWQAATQHTGDDAWVRAHGFVHPVTYGQQMAIGLLGGFCFFVRSGPGSPRRRLALFAGLTTAALVLNQTRGALLGAAAGFSAICWVDKTLRRWLLRGAAAGLAVLAIWEVMPTGGRSLLDLIHKPEIMPGGVVNPYMARYVLWDAAMAMFRDHPWTGVGPGNYHSTFTRYFSGTLDGERIWGSAHNLYLHQLAERGLLGIGALGAALSILTAQAYRRARSNPNAWNLWAWGSMTAFLVMNCTEVAFQNEQITTLVLAVWAWSQANRDMPDAGAPR